MRRYSIVICLLVISFIVVGSASAVTYQTGVGVGFTFNPTLSINLSSADILISNLAPGNAADSNTITVTVNTNTAYGYTLNATVGEATNYNTRNLIRSDINDSFSSIAYGSSLASLTTDNTWGYAYKPSGQSSTWTTYSGLPLYNDTENVATLISTENAADSDSIEFKIAAKASATQPAGEYKNVINFIAVSNPEPHLEPVPCESGKICYNVNSLDPTEGTMGKQTASANASVMLLASNFSRDGYGFAGWSDVHDYDTNPNAHFYGPQEDITTPADMSSGLSLYAVWVPSAGTMQSSTTSVCNRLTTAPTDGTANLSSVSALTDQRDNETYAIAKLADGKCWMIENLRLESTNSDNSTGALAQGYGTSATYGNFSGLANAESAWANNSTTANSLYYSGTQDGTASIDIGTGSNPGQRFPRYNHDNTNTRAANPAPTSNSSAMYSYGNYYSWSAAIADTTAYTSNNTSVTNTSICPAGWHLPKGGNKSNEANNEFWSLVVTGINNGTNPASYESSTQPYYTGTPEGTEASNKLRAYPNNIVYSGYVNSGSVTSRGLQNNFWSSTANSSKYAYYLSLSSSSVYPGTLYGNKYLGWAVRCVASGV